MTTMNQHSSPTGHRFARSGEDESRRSEIFLGVATITVLALLIIGAAFGVTTLVDYAQTAATAFLAH